MCEEIQQYREKIVKERFFKKVDKTDTCWIWRSYTSRCGNPLYKINWSDAPSYLQRFCGGKENYSAEKVSWVLSGKEFPANHFLRRKCQNGRCVNPDHYDLLEYNLTNCPD